MRIQVSNWHFRAVAAFAAVSVLTVASFGQNYRRSSNPLVQTPVPNLCSAGSNSLSGKCDSSSSSCRVGAETRATPSTHANQAKVVFNPAASSGRRVPDRER
jgi:hypothetical protein